MTADKFQNESSLPKSEGKRLLSKGVAVVTLASCTIFAGFLESSGQQGAIERTHQFSTHSTNGLVVSESTGSPLHSTQIMRFTLHRAIAPDGDSPESFLNQPNDFTCIPGLGYYVVDSGNHRVVMYSEAGEFLRAIGQEGSGPGDFRYPQEIEIHDGQLRVRDSNRRTTVLSTSGEYLSILSDRLHGNTIVPLPSSIAWTRTIIDWADPSEIAIGLTVVSESDTLLELTTDSVESIRMMAARRANGDQFQARVPVSFSGYPTVSIVPGRGIMATTGWNGEIRWFSELGAPTRVMHIQPTPKTSRDERERLARDRYMALRDLQVDRSVRLPYTLVEERLPIAEREYFWSIAQVDDRGYIWLDRPRLHSQFLSLEQEPVETMIVAPTGEHIGDVLRPPGISYRVTGGHYLLVSSDPRSGGYVLLDYRIEPVGGFRYEVP